MPIPRRHLPADAGVVGHGLAEIRRQLDVPDGFPPEVLDAVATLPSISMDGRVDRRDLPFVTIDPPGSTDLDQALYIEPAPDGGGHVVWYAIADVAAFVSPGDPIDREAWNRGVTLYAPDQRAPLHPPELSEGVASLLPARDRPAVLWRLELDPDGALVDTTVGRALVQSREQLSYDQAQARVDSGDARLTPLALVGRQRLALERDRGGLSLPVPEQEVERTGGRYRLGFRAPLPVEEWNAQLSLLCGMAAAHLMLAGGWGLLRTLPPASDEAIAALRRHARALGIDWGSNERYGDVVRRLDARHAEHAAFLVQATRLFRGAGLLPLRPGGTAPDELVVHAAIAAPYAHVTAPLRRLGDRYATEAVLATVAGREPPAWVTDALDDVPAAVSAGNRRAGELDRAVVDHLEALILSSCIGETFGAVVVDRRSGGSVLQFREPAVVAVADEERDLGEEVRVRVDTADPVARQVSVSIL